MIEVIIHNIGVPLLTIRVLSSYNTSHEGILNKEAISSALLVLERNDIMNKVMMLM